MKMSPNLFGSKILRMFTEKIAPHRQSYHTYSLKQVSKLIWSFGFILVGI